MDRTIQKTTPASLSLIFIIMLILVHTTMNGLDSARTMDDAFISYRYARNLIQGEGLVFNPGEMVEGYTNFLWTVLLAGVMLLFDPVPASKFLGMSCNVILLVLVWRFSRRLLTRWHWIPALILAFDPGFVRYATRGLETSLFTLLLWIAFTTFLLADDTPQRLLRAGFWVSLLTLTRPEGFLIAAVLSLCLIRPKIRTTISCLAWYWSGLGIVSGPYLLWKLVYYGSVLPNTFYAKTGGGIYQTWRGIAYVVNGWGFPEYVLLGVVVISVLSKWSDYVVRVSTLVCFFFLVYIIKVGGDSLGPDRFLVPLTPLLMWAGPYAVQRMVRIKTRGTLTYVVVSLLFLIILALNSYPLRKNILHPKIYSTHYEQNYNRTRLGKCLAQIAQSGDSIATSLIGRVPYYSSLYTIDVLGLIDPYLAHLKPKHLGLGAAGHEKYDREYVLSRQPTFIFPREVIVQPPPEPAWLIRLRTLISGEYPKYQPVILNPPFSGYSLEVHDCGGRRIKLWKKKDRSQSLEPDSVEHDKPSSGQ